MVHIATIVVIADLSKAATGSYHRTLSATAGAVWSRSTKGVPRPTPPLLGPDSESSPLTPRRLFGVCLLRRHESVGDVCRVEELPLLFPVVPAQALVQGLEPVRDLVIGADGRNRVDRRGHPQAAGREQGNTSRQYWATGKKVAKYNKREQKTNGGWHLV